MDNVEIKQVLPIRPFLAYLKGSDNILSPLIIVPAHTRTIYVKHNKYHLNIPKLAYLRTRLVALDEYNRACYPPFPNIHCTFDICLGSNAFIHNKADFINAFFCKAFTFTWMDNVAIYYPDVNVVPGQYLPKFYEKWQQEKSLELKPIRGTYLGMAMKYTQFEDK